MEDAGARRPFSGGVDDQPAAPLDAAERDAEVEAALVAAPASGRMPQLAQGRSPHPTTCPFFRSLGADGVLGPPQEAPDPINRCASSGEVKPQSYRQQELVCLTAGHVNCPRYLRGVAVVRPEPMARPIPLKSLGRPTGAAIVLLAASVVASIGIVLARGGLALPAVSPSATAGALASVSPTAPPTPLASPSPIPTSEPSPLATAATSPSLSPSPSISPRPTPPPTPGPTPRSDRYDLLEPCPDRPRCWIYTVRSGDNLYSIANYFGIPLETVRDLNPWTRRQGLRAGQQLILPPPTR